MAFFEGSCGLKHKRSPEAVVRRIARAMEARQVKVRLRSLVLQRSFRDFERCESVCLLTRVDLLAVAGPEVQVCDVPDVERGEVLVDSRGEGSFQQ